MNFVHPDDCWICTANVDDVPGPKTDPDIPPLVNLVEAGEILGVKRAQAHRLLMDGKLPGLRVGGTWVFRREVVEHLAATRPKRPAE